MREIYDLIIAELRGSWRFRWLAVLCAWLVCLVGWSVVYMMPDSYESKATVLIDTTSDLSKLLGSLTVTSDVLTRIEAVRSAMLGRPQLEKVARDTDLHLRAGQSGSMNGVILNLRSNIYIDSNLRRGANIYEISYHDSDPFKSFEVVTALLNNFVEQFLGANREGTKRAQEFLRKELAQLEADLTKAENRLAEFKRENMGQMPGEGGGYYARLQSEMAELEKTHSELRKAERQRDTLRQQLAGEQPTIDSAASQSELDLRIGENERRLEELQLRFTDQHPDVIAVKATLEQLRDQKEAQLAELQNKDGAGIASDNPVFQNIQIELASVNVQIASLQEQRSTHERKIEELKDLVDVLPQIEAELGRLNRDYDVKQAQYQALLQRLEIAELSESAEQSDEVKFQVIDPPIVPSAPSAPNRPMLLAGVLLAGLGTGGGFAFLLNQLKPVFTDPKTIRQATGLPILGSVQVLRTKERRRRRVTQLGAFAIAISSLCVVFAVVVLFHSPGSEALRSLVLAQG